MCWYGFTVKLAIFLPSLETGGLASLALELGGAAQLKGMKVKVVTLYTSTPEAATNLEINSLKVPSPQVGYFKPVVAFIRLLRAYSLLSKYQPDKIICLDPSSAFLCLLVKLRFRKLRVAVGCYTPPNLLTRSDKFIIKGFYHFASLVVAPSISTGQSLKTMNKRIYLRIIDNPFTSASSACFNGKEQIGKKWDCLYLGRLSEEKGVRQILSIAESAPDLKFCIAGDGIERKYLEDSILKRNIRNVELAGWQLPSVCLPLSRVLLLPSKHETFGIVIIESWLHGVPVVVFEGADGPRELLESMHGGGLVKDYGNDSEWIARIREQLLNPLSDDFMNQTLQRFSGFEVIEAWL